eukprot:scaffold1277_cov329-Prasinococcus_capsulatus_cf.AAC.3
MRRRMMSLAMVECVVAASIDMRPPHDDDDDAQGRGVRSGVAKGDGWEGAHALGEQGPRRARSTGGEGAGGPVSHGSAPPTLPKARPQIRRLSPREGADQTTNQPTNPIPPQPRPRPAISRRAVGHGLPSLPYGRAGGGCKVFAPARVRACRQPSRTTGRRGRRSALPGDCYYRPTTIQPTPRPPQRPRTGAFTTALPALAPTRSVLSLVVCRARLRGQAGKRARIRGDANTTPTQQRRCSSSIQLNLSRSTLRLRASWRSALAARHTPCARRGCWQARGELSPASSRAPAQQQGAPPSPACCCGAEVGAGSPGAAHRSASAASNWPRALKLGRAEPTRAGGAPLVRYVDS